MIVSDSMQVALCGLTAPKMTCRRMTTSTSESDPPEDIVGSSIQVLGKSSVDTAALSDILQVL